MVTISEFDGVFKGHEWINRIGCYFFGCMCWSAIGGSSGAKGNPWHSSNVFEKNETHSIFLSLPIGFDHSFSRCNIFGFIRLYRKVVNTLFAYQHIGGLDSSRCSTLGPFLWSFWYTVSSLDHQHWNHARKNQRPRSHLLWSIFLDVCIYVPRNCALLYVLWRWWNRTHFGHSLFGRGSNHSFHVARNKRQVSPRDYEIILILGQNVIDF